MGKSFAVTLSALLVLTGSILPTSASVECSDEFNITWNCSYLCCQYEATGCCPPPTVGTNRVDSGNGSGSSGFNLVALWYIIVPIVIVIVVVVCICFGIFGGRRRYTTRRTGRVVRTANNKVAAVVVSQTTTAVPLAQPGPELPPPSYYPAQPAPVPSGYQEQGYHKPAQPIRYQEAPQAYPLQPVGYQEPPQAYNAQPEIGPPLPAPYPVGYPEPQPSYPGEPAPVPVRYYADPYPDNKAPYPSEPGFATAPPPHPY